MKKTERLQQNIRKYINYFFEQKGFTTDLAMGEISPMAVQSAGIIRGENRAPALLVHGIMPRSGSVYVGELLRRHPDLCGNPQGLWEMPALQLTPHIRHLQQKFIEGYQLNEDKIGADDFLPLVGASLIAYLHQDVPPPQRALAKMPNVQYLNQFFGVFPHENLLVLVRDGRDVVHSTLRTWKQTNFIQVSLRWRRSAMAVCHALRGWEQAGQTGYWLGRYEDALRDPHFFVEQACDHFNLDKARYPFSEIDKVRVIGSSKLAKKQGDVTWMTHHDKPKDFKPTAYWQNWSQVRKSVFKVIAGQELMALGYCRDNKW